MFKSTHLNESMWKAIPKVTNVLKLSLCCILYMASSQIRLFDRYWECFFFSFVVKISQMFFWTSPINDFKNCRHLSPLTGARKKSSISTFILIKTDLSFTVIAFKRNSLFLSIFGRIEALTFLTSLLNNVGFWYNVLIS